MKTRVRMLIHTGWLVFFAQAVLACRIIDPIPFPIPIMPPAPPQPVSPRPIETVSHAARIRVRDQAAEVRVDATFRNPNGFAMEGTYWFPLPPEAAVKDFQLEINGKPVKAELLDADKARQAYEEIVRRRRDPALLEWVGTQMLKCRIFPMEPGRDTKVSLSYTQVLREDSGVARVEYPLRSARTEGGRIGQLVVDVSIESRAPLKMVYSPSHDFDIRRADDHKVSLTLEEKDADPERDVTVLFARDAADVGLSLLSYKPSSEDGTFLLAVTPKVELDPSGVSRKDVVFVCDTSGSMKHDGKIGQAREALSYCVRSLNPGDRFNIIAFSGEVKTFRPALAERTDEAIREAAAFIKGLDAVGGTAINDALVAAMGMLREPPDVPMIVFLTDGNPTIGERDTEKILANVKQAGAAACRVFVFGVGYDVNTKLLDLLAERHRGTREYVQPMENIEVKVSNFYQKISNPVLSDVAVDFGGARVADVYPRALPDLFHGSQLTLLGRFAEPGDFTVTLKGRVGEREVAIPHRATLGRDAVDDYLPRLWALRKVAFLLDEIRLHGEDKELVEEVKRLGKLHGILTPYTSFLVIEEDAAVPAPMRRELQSIQGQARDGFASRSMGRAAVADSAGIAAAKGGVAAAMPAAEGASTFGFGGLAPSGTYGGGLAPEAASARFEKDLEDAARQCIRHVGARTFYVKADGLWVDGAYDEARDAARIADVALWSDEFFDLVRKHPEVGELAARSAKFLVCLEGGIYRVR